MTLRRIHHYMPVLAGLLPACLLSGCVLLQGYSNAPLYPTDISSVCLTMFDNRTFWRNIEYDLTDALSKRIESQTPYKIMSAQDRADTLMSGQIVQTDQSVSIRDRDTGSALEKEVRIQAVVSWKNLKTGELLLDNQRVTASAGYSSNLGQGQGYATALAANRLAIRIVELMEKRW